MVDDRATRVGIRRGQRAGVGAGLDERHRARAVLDDGVDRRRAATLGIEEQFRTAGGHEALVDHRADIESRASVIQETARGQGQRGTHAERDAGDDDVARLQAVDRRVRRDARRRRRITDVDVIRRDIRRGQRSRRIRGRAGRAHRGDAEPGDIGRPVAGTDGGPAAEDAVGEAAARRRGGGAPDRGELDAGAAAGLAGRRGGEVDRGIGRTGQPAGDEVGGIDAGAAEDRVDEGSAFGQGHRTDRLGGRGLCASTELDDASAESNRSGIVDAVVRVGGAAGVLEV